MLNEEQLRKIELKADEIRKDVIEMLVTSGYGHAAGSLGMADVFATLYFSGIINWSPEDPWKPDRDRVILSNGHICPVWYATLAHAGAFSHQELKTLQKLGSRLQGHPHYRELPGIENSAGSLGQGLSQAVGVAWAARLDLATYRVFCLMSDGELQEGQNWEALSFAAKNNLHHLTAIIDRNGIQIDGYTEQIMPLEPLANKLRAFNWNVIEIDGNKITEIYTAIEKVRTIPERPSVIIAHTVPGKGVEFIEGNYLWHAKVPDKAEGEEALRELRNLWGKIMAE